MGIFDKFRKQETPPPAPKPAKIDAPPYEQFCMVDGRWMLNPNYDPTAPKPKQIEVTGLGKDDDDEDD